jgi:hypothetical protein
MLYSIPILGKKDPIIDCVKKKDPLSRCRLLETFVLGIQVSTFKVSTCLAMGIGWYGATRHRPPNMNCRTATNGGTGSVFQLTNFAVPRFAL